MLEIAAAEPTAVVAVNLSSLLARTRDVVVQMTVVKTKAVLFGKMMVATVERTTKKMSVPAERTTLLVAMIGKTTVGQVEKTMFVTAG